MTVQPPDYAQRRSHLVQIFQAALRQVDPYRAIHNQVEISGSRMHIKTGTRNVTIDLASYERVLLLGAGKATAPMARAFEELLGERLGSGFICVKEGHGEALQRVELTEASHPVPDERGLAAAKRIVELATAAAENTLVITCISGGASALLPCPIDGNIVDGSTGLTLEDKQAATRELLRCGAGIAEINCVRKHLSALKGGGLLRLLAPARSLNFILSDVIGDDLSSIASGMTCADPTTFTDALKIIDTYNLRCRLPKQIIHVLEQGVKGELEETLKPGDQALGLAENIIIGSNRQALIAAAEKAHNLGYHSLAVTAQLEGEARYTARFLAAVGRDVAISDMLAKRPACLLFGGETVVTITGNGKGGRNQELALAFLQHLGSWPAEQRQAVSFLSGATDGNDGPTDAAGAFADIELLQKAGETELDLDDYLANNDSYHFFDTIGGLLRTGPTNTNVCDLQMMLIH